MRSQKYLAAVSGGVDSVVLLDMLAKKHGGDVVVAHFDHGIRPDSAADARFVRTLAQKYQLPFFLRREELGKTASEAMARTRRYAFLRQLAAQQGATITTAHHADDVVETIAINLLRGTGWRGLAGLAAQDIERPLLNYRKTDIYEYATANRLEWVEDSTNRLPLYLRNRVRRATNRLPETVHSKLLHLHGAQIKLKQAIDSEIEQLLIKNQKTHRYFFIMIDDNIAPELLRAVVYEATGKKLTRPQLAQGILAIKIAAAGSVAQLGEGVELSFSKQSFIASRH